MAIFTPLQPSALPTILPMMQEFYALDNYDFDLATAEKLFNEFIENPDLGQAWLIWVDGEAVGYVILTFIFSFEYKGKIAFLDELFISEKVRGKGIGKKALDFIQEKVEQLSLQLIYLEIEPHNETAQQLYLAKNFVMHKRKLMKFIPH